MTIATIDKGNAASVIDVSALRLNILLAFADDVTPTEDEGVSYRPFPGSTEPTRGQVVVYVAYAADNTVLYVGRTKDIRRRLLQHRRLAPWWQYATHVLYLPVERGEAEATETAMIRAGEPIFNVQRRSA